MVKVNQKQLKDPVLRDSLKRIWGCSEFHPTKARDIAARIKRIDEEFRLTDEEYDKLILKYAVKDEHGNVKPIEGGRPGTFKIEPGREEEFARACDGLSVVEVDIPVVGFTFDELDQVTGLSPAHLSTLEPFLSH